jgi:hypothetical protein
MVGILSVELITGENHNIWGEILRVGSRWERIVLLFGSDCEIQEFVFSRPKYRDDGQILLEYTSNSRI